MSDHRLRIVLLLLWPIGMAGWAAAQSSRLPVLTSVDQIRRLTPDKAQLGYPVRIRGVITDDIPRPNFFVQDETAGIYIGGHPSLGGYHHLWCVIRTAGCHLARPL